MLNVEGRCEEEKRKDGWVGGGSLDGDLGILLRMV